MCICVCSKFPGVCFCQELTKLDDIWLSYNKYKKGDVFLRQCRSAGSLGSALRLQSRSDGLVPLRRCRRLDCRHNKTSQSTNQQLQKLAGAITQHQHRLQQPSSLLPVLLSCAQALLSGPALQQPRPTVSPSPQQQALPAPSSQQHCGCSSLQ